LEGGTLFLSRNIKVFSCFKKVFEDCGFEDVTLSSLENTALTLQLNEIKPRNVFFHSEFFSGVTPYMIGCLLVKFPELNIHVINFGNFPDSLAVRFIFHGAKSYLDINCGIEEFRNGLKIIKSGQDYLSPNIKQEINLIDELANSKREMTNREWQVLFLVCNGFNNKQIAANLQISKRTVNYHLNSLYKISDTKNREDLMRMAISLEWVNKKHLVFHGNDIKTPSRMARVF